jgi:ABC-type nitrate/sulfonate/bicarbonate transport system substrate-binding protein
VAQDKGYFKEEGLDVDFVQLGYKEYTDALIAGRVDIISPASFPVLFGIESESPGSMKFFHAAGEKKGGELVYGILVRKDSDILKLTDLKGKRIAVDHPVTMVNLKLILSKIGMAPDTDVNITQIDKSIVLTSLLSGKVDAILLDQPNLTAAIEKGETKLLIANPRAEYIMDPYWSGAPAVSSQYLLQNKETMRKVLKALDKALDIVRKDPLEAKQLFIKYASLDNTLAGKVGYYFEAKSGESVDLQSMQNLADLLVEHNILKKKIDAKNMYIDLSTLK